MTPGDEQDVVWRLWIDVFKRDHIFILVHNITWYLTPCNFAEQAVIHIHSSHTRGIILCRTGFVGVGCSSYDPGCVALCMRCRAGLYRRNFSLGLRCLLLRLRLCW